MTGTLLMNPGKTTETIEVQVGREDDETIGLIEVRNATTVVTMVEVEIIVGDVVTVVSVEKNVDVVTTVDPKVGNATLPNMNPQKVRDVVIFAREITVTCSADN